MIPRLPAVLLAAWIGVVGLRVVAEGTVDLEFRRVEIPAERNAATDWARATSLYVPLSSAAKEACRDAWRTGLPTDSGGVRQALEDNRAALEAVETGLRRPEVVWVRRNVTEPEPALQVLPDLQRLRLFQARQSLLEKHADTAISHLLGSVRLGQRMCEGSGALIHYLVGHGVRSMAEQAIRGGALGRHFEGPELARLAEGLPSLSGEPRVFATVLRVEWTDYELPMPDVVRLAEMQEEAYRTDPELYAVVVPENLHRLHRIFLNPSLVKGHERPYDYAAALTAATSRIRIRLANLERAWKDQKEEPDDTDEVAETLLSDAEELLEAVKQEPLPLSKAAVDRIRPGFNRLKNPIGRLYAAMPSVTVSGPLMVFRARTEREVTGAVLAVARFRTLRGRMPADWAELVEAGLLPKPPMDFFADAPLHYSKDRAVIWSVGKDGRDNGGASTAAPDWKAPDTVWRLDPKQP